MRVSISIEWVMQRAQQEAAAGEFSEITPEHLLAALLKFSEISGTEVQQIASAPLAARQLALEANALRQELEGRSIDSKRVRQELRSHLGHGGQAHDGGYLHRSPASRQVFEHAARMAEDEGSDVLLAAHLLNSLLASPT